MSLFVQDSFTGTAGTDLTAHTGETGATWAEHPNYTAGQYVLTDANRARPATNPILVYASGVPSAPNRVEVTTDLRCVTNATNRTIGAAARIDTSASTFYVWRYLQSTGYFDLLAIVAGAPTQLATYSQALSTNTTYAIRFQLRGEYLRLLVDGVERISVKDSSIGASDSQRVGVYAQDGTATNTTAYHLDNFTAQALPSTLASTGVG